MIKEHFSRQSYLLFSPLITYKSLTFIFKDFTCFDSLSLLMSSSRNLMYVENDLGREHIISTQGKYFILYEVMYFRYFLCSNDYLEQHFHYCSSIHDISV